MGTRLPPKDIRLNEYTRRVRPAPISVKAHIQLCYDEDLMVRPARTLDKELFFRALADRTRLRLVNLMGDDEVCVCFFVEILRTPQPKVSRHLAYLRRAGVVAARRQGTWMHYRLVEPSDPDATRVLRDVRAWLANDRDMQADRSRLVKVCCSPRLPEQLRGAPLPVGLAGAGRPAPRVGRESRRVLDGADDKSVLLLGKVPALKP